MSPSWGLSGFSCLQLGPAEASWAKGPLATHCALTAEGGGQGGEGEAAQASDTKPEPSWGEQMNLTTPCEVSWDRKGSSPEEADLIQSGGVRDSPQEDITILDCRGYPKAGPLGDTQ